MSSLYKRGRIWWYKGRDDTGHVVRVSLRTRNKSVADLKKKRLDNRAVNPVGDTLGAWIDRYAATCRLHTSRQHAANVAYRLHELQTALGGDSVEVETLERSEIQRFLDSLLTDGKARWTVKGYRVAISGFGRFLMDNGRLPDNPARGVRLPPVPRTLPIYLTDDEIARTLAEARRLGWYLPVLVGLKTGMRSAEIRAMRWEHIDWTRHLILVPETKTDRPRAIPIHRELAGPLADRRQPEGYVFRGAKGGMIAHKLWRDALKPMQQTIPAFRKATRVGRGWHLLRHTFATRYVQAGGDIYRLSKILGHGSVTVTERYAHFAPPQADPVLEQV